MELPVCEDGQYFLTVFYSLKSCQFVREDRLAFSRIFISYYYNEFRQFVREDRLDFCYL